MKKEKVDKNREYQQTPGNRYSIIGSYIARSPACKRTLFPGKDSHLGFWSGNLFLIAPFPGLCLLVPFSKDSNIDSAVVENIKGMTALRDERALLKVRKHATPRLRDG